MMITADRHQNTLSEGYELHWYTIKRVLGHGAFGITYLAHDINLDRMVAIKEYMPGQLGTRTSDLSIQPLSEEHAEEFRNGLNRFISEARTLTHFEHPNLIRVFNVFEKHNTAYMVMNYEQGETLHSLLKTRNRFDESEILRIVLPLMDGLEKMHRTGFIHRDIKPGNIFIRNDGSPVLLDFGSARQTATDNPQTLTNFISPGYAPIEQYSSKSDKQGPWTDIYSLGATIYRLITGTAPPNPVDRSEKLNEDGNDAYRPLVGEYRGIYSRGLLTAVDQALALRAQERPADISVWRNTIGVDIGDITTIPIYDEDDVPTQPQGLNVAWARAVSDRAPESEEPTQVHDSPPAGQQADSSTSSAPSFFLNRVLPVVTLLSALVFVAVLVLWGNNTTWTAPVPTIETEPVPVPVPEQETISTPLAETTPDNPAPVAPEAKVARLEEKPADILAIDKLPIADESARIDRLLTKADENINALQLTSPEGDNAYDQYQEVLTLEPENPDAIEGMQTIADLYIDLTYDALAADKPDEAEHYLQKAAGIWPDSPRLADARTALAESDEPGFLNRLKDWASEKVNEVRGRGQEADVDDSRSDEQIRRAMSGFK